MELWLEFCLTPCWAGRNPLPPSNFCTFQVGKTRAALYFKLRNRANDSFCGLLTWDCQLISLRQLRQESKIRAEFWFFRSWKLWFWVRPRLWWFKWGLSQLGVLGRGRNSWYNFFRRECWWSRGSWEWVWFQWWFQDGLHFPFWWVKWVLQSFWPFRSQFLWGWQ